MLFHGKLINFDNYDGHLWPSMGDELAQIYSTWRSYPAKIPDKAKNQFKKAFILIGRYKINLNQYLDPNSCQPFSSFFDFAKTILNNTNSVNDCNKMNYIFQSCCLPDEELQLKNIYNQKLQQFNNNNQGLYKNNNQLNKVNNQINNNNFANVLFTTTSRDPFFGKIIFQWKRNDNRADIIGLTVNGSVIDKNQLQQLIQPGGLYTFAKDGNSFICIKFKNNILEIYDLSNPNHPLTTINLLQQQVNQNQNVNQNFNANHNVNKRNTVQEAFIQNNANQQNFQQKFSNFNNVNFNQQIFQPQFTPDENNVLDSIQQFYSSNMFSNKYSIICNCYNGNIQKINEINNFYLLHKNAYKELNSYYNKQYAEYWINRFTAKELKQLVLKCNYNDKRTANFRSFLEDAGCRYLAYFLESPNDHTITFKKKNERLTVPSSPLAKLNQQQRLKIINETFEQNSLIPKSQYKKYFGDIRFQNFLAWYAKLQNLPDKPNSDYLAKLFGGCKTNNWAFEQNRYNAILQWQISVNNNGQSWNIQACNDKILAYYIGYILFSNDPNTQAFGRLFAIRTIFPWAKKYSYNSFGTIDLFPESNRPLVGGVEICQPKPVDKDVKKCLEKLSDGGINELPKEGYEYTTENGVTTIKKGDKLIFEGKLSQDCKGFTDGTLVIKYDNQDQPDECYEGQFKGTKMEGEGTYVFAKRFPDKEKHEAYEGQFKDGQMHGSGTYYTADGFSAEITYKNGIAMNVKKAKDRSDTDVIVFDFFGFSSEAFEDEKHGGRYNSSFFITDNGSYQYKREKIFGLKDEEGLPALSQQPNEKQQKAMDFIKTHMLIQGADHYAGLFNEKELSKIPGFDLQKAMQEFGNGQLLQLSQLIIPKAKERWACFVIDKIGPDAFNKLYLEDNMNYYFNNIQQNTDKKLKVVLNIHGTPQLSMSFGSKDQGYKEKFELINNVFQRVALLGRDMYVSNNSCYGSQFLDDKQDIFKQIGVDIFANKADFKPIITHTEIDKSVDKIEKKYGSTDKFLKICELKAEADSWRLTKMYGIKKDAEELFNETLCPSKSLPTTLRQFFIDKFCHNFKFNGSSVNLTGKKIFHEQTPGGILGVLVLPLSNFLGSGNNNIDFLEKNEEIFLKQHRSKQTFNEHILAFFDFVKRKLFLEDDLNKLTDEGRKSAVAIKAKRDIIETIRGTKKNKTINHGSDFECLQCTEEEVLNSIDNACKELLEGYLNDEDIKQIDSLKEEIIQKFNNNEHFTYLDLKKMLSKVDLFNLIKKWEDEFVKEKMQGKLEANNMTLGQLDKFYNTEVNEMFGHLSTSIWLTRSFLLGGILSKKMGVDKILEGFREKCYCLLYKFGDQEINDIAIQKLQTELSQEIGKIKTEIQSKCQRYCEDIEMNNWYDIESKLQELKNEILTTDNYYTQQLSPEQIEALKQQTFDFDKENFVNFLRLLPGKIEASMGKATKNIVNYCEDIKNNNKQSIKDLLKQLKNGPMQNNHIIYSTNMTGMTPSYMIELIDEHQKKSNRNLAKMYYEVKNGQIVPLVKNKQEYEKALRKFENKLANTEKKGSSNDTPGLEGVKFHALDDFERIQSEELMKFVKEGKKRKNEIMGWIGKEEGIVEEKFPGDNCQQKFIGDLNPQYTKEIFKNNSKKRQNTIQNVPQDSKGPRDKINKTSTYSNYNNYNVTTGVK